ncbi:MAG: hypothetical protein ACLVAK_08575 [Clostridia bacterium]
MKTKEMKGITLVALVVTIVVLLILAGVSINLVLGDNGIIAKAKDAKTKSAEASENDLKGMNSLVSEMEGTLAGNGGAGGSGAGTKVPEAATAETAPYFPDNTFTKKEGTIDTGLVIQDASGNEYVWVVVPRTTAVYATTGLGKTTFTDADYTSIENDLKDYTSTHVTKSGYSDTYAADTDNVGWFADETAYNNLKNSMLKSVYENGGFYVGRYEAGIGTNRTSNTDKNSDGKYIIEGMPTPVTKADAYPYTHVTRTQAQNLAINVNSGTKTSSLMFGVQWDLVLAFMHNKGNISDSTLTSNSETIGNYYNSTFQLSQTGKYETLSYGTLSSTWNIATAATANFVDSSRNKIAQSSYGDGVLVTTGTSEKNKVMNIYDIAGNVNEWTLEKTSITNGPCAPRGGSFFNTGSFAAAYRGAGGTNNTGYGIGIRVSLF